MIDLITRQRGACVCTEKPIDRSIVITELREIGLNITDIRVRLLIGVVLITRLDVRVIVVGIVVVTVIRIKIPRVKSVIQTDPERAVPAKPVTVEQIPLAPVPIPMLSATLASKDMMISAHRRFIGWPRRCRTRSLTLTTTR